MRTTVRCILAAAGLAGCTRSDFSRPRDTGARQTGVAVAVAPARDDTVRPVDSLTPAELALFAPLPAAFLDRGAAPSRARIGLGRTLYYENLLSGGHNVSCNSCHPLNGFGADGRPLSFGDHGQLGGRNAPSVYNAAGQTVQFWDGRAATVEEQAKGPILNPAEMGMPAPGAVLEHLRASPVYRAAFRAAFPDETDPITYDNVGRAIGAFERGLVTPSRWDRRLGGDRSALTPEETRGAKAFIANGCAGCHNGALVGGGSLRPVGLVHPWPIVSDSGRYRVTGQPADLYVFKVPSLRNVARTGPYFSDGSVASLDDAIRLMAWHQLGRRLSGAEIADIHAWLNSLTGELPAAYIAQPPLPPPTR